MDDRSLTPDFSVSPQLEPSDLGVAARQGYRSIIINRPDGEGGQPGAAEMSEAGRRHGLDVRYVPVNCGEITDSDLAAFQEVALNLPGPILAYCRTGTRSAMLWALSQAGHLSTDAILSTAKQAGYDLEGLRPRLDAMSPAVAGTGQGALHG